MKVPPAQLFTKIISDVERALTRFKGLSPEQVVKARSSIKRYRRLLVRLSTKGSTLIEKAALHSFDAHFCAAVRATERAGLTATSYSELKKMADRARAGDAAAETVSARWIEKDNGDFRLIVKGGVLRNTRLLVFRDALSSLGVDKPVPLLPTRSGRGKSIHASGR
ncbi:hypothetical protein QA640_04505 [Bradyrhizobium sp. CB82]|uniref:hypothetical protein n=1 Tax=Bradyrhizobium sp. CB82 TaxID=3039159 RepID=UPI0024B1FE48|nr:hypothetical protein [Bradyrhizobium sp. CB82]WFU41781.1 hypothetical protein QA640_04505 [Bradyrhizobium sp. CB82]